VSGETVVYESEQRASPADFVSQIWRSRSVQGGAFTSVATSTMELVFSKIAGRRTVHLRGPESRPTQADCPPDGEWLGVQLRPGTFLPAFARGMDLVNRDIELPTSPSGFWLHGSTWAFPTHDNVDVFIDRLARAGLVQTDALIVDALARQSAEPPTRALQRRFLAVTGLSQTMLRQIERARIATALLRQGEAIGAVADQLGLYDQAHLNRLLRRFIGHTPARLQAQAGQPAVSII
jgi:AraC-like DNA-binding protein